MGHGSIRTLLEGWRKADEEKEMDTAKKRIARMERAYAAFGKGLEEAAEQHMSPECDEDTRYREAIVLLFVYAVEALLQADYTADQVHDMVDTHPSIERKPLPERIIQ